MISDSVQDSAALPLPVLVPASEDRFGYFKMLGISSVAFKVTSQESKDLFAIEITLVEKGGPAKHVHLSQDEWFYDVEGEFIFEVGNERYHLKPGDSLFGPKKVPHAWAFAKGVRGRMIFVVAPVGNLEEFFVNAAKAKSLPGPDQNLWRPYGLEWIGPPLQIE